MLVKSFTFILSLVCLCAETPLRPISTYSIVALDAETGQLGVAVQSHWFSVGTVVPWAKAGVGAVATQSIAEPSYGPKGLALMEKGTPADEALQSLLAKDIGKNVRQVAMVDAQGNVGVHTGSRCISHASHLTGKNYSVQANIMAKSTVPSAMVQAFESTTGDLAERMLAALDAAEAEGGDLRGRQSAAMLVVSGEPTGDPWTDRIVDLEVADHENPLIELRRLLRISQAYRHAQRGDEYMEKNEMDSALQEYSAATKLYPENPELPFWTAVTLAQTGELEKALLIFNDVFSRNGNLRELVPRIVQAGFLTVEQNVLQEILAQ
ncbi:MAG: DUF1028 domain-containing protein [Candidatus Neomarinimicrobiota bacterium]|jgi:uncharacterized Ntn-hydrolase superfamily protein|nr:DUF1028 domain-containing protein [Candidatus Neomarinimicrobiota bacterium]